MEVRREQIVRAPWTFFSFLLQLLAPGWWAGQELRFASELAGALKGFQQTGLFDHWLF